MTDPLVTVIVPQRNAGNLLGMALHSLEIQTIGTDAFEVVVINDGSTDWTPEIVAEFSERLNLTVIDNAEPRGVSTARNQGLDIAGGEHIAFLDSDDWFGPDRLRTLVDEITRLDVEFIRTDYVRVRGFQRLLSAAPLRRRCEALDPRDFINPLTVPTMVDYPQVWNGLYSRAMKEKGLLHMRPDLRTCEDRAWTWHHHIAAESFAVVDCPDVFHRRDLESSLVSVIDDRQLDFIPAFTHIFQLLIEHPELEEFYPKALRSYLVLVNNHIEKRVAKLPDVLRTKMFEDAPVPIGMFGEEVLDRALLRFGRDRLDTISPILESAKADR